MFDAGARAMRLESNQQENASFFFIFRTNRQNWKLIISDPIATCQDTNNGGNANNNVICGFNFDKFVAENRQWQIGMEEQNASIISMPQVGKNFKIQFSFVAGTI